MIDTLKKSGFFSVFDEEALQGLQSHIQKEDYEGGQEIFAEATEGDCMYLIASGQVEISKKGRVLTRLEEGDIFGEMGLFGNDLRSASAVSAGRSRLIKIKNKDMEKFLFKYPDSGCKFLFNAVGEISQRLRQTSSYLVAVYETGKIIGADYSSQEMSQRILIRLMDEIKDSTGGIVMIYNRYTGLFDLHASENNLILDEEKASFLIEEAGSLEIFKTYKGEGSVFISPSMDDEKIKGYIIIEKKGTESPLSSNEEIITSAVANQLALGLVKTDSKSDEEARELFERKKFENI